MDADAELEGLAVLSRATCIELLERASVGRVGCVVDALPEVLPVNYAADALGTIVFRTTGTSILGRVAGQSVVFEVDGLDEVHHAGWSVCVHGCARELTGGTDPMAERLRSIGVLSWAPGTRDRWFAIAPEEITGRRIPVDATRVAFGGWLPGIVS